MLFREVTPSGWRGALVGLVEGAIAALAMLVAWTRLAARLPTLTVATIAAIALVGGLALALGRGLTGRMLGAGVGSLFGLLVGVSLASTLPTNWDIEQPRPEAAGPFSLTGPTLDGKKLDLADYRGKVVLIDFWATWCKPCRVELPNLRLAYDRYHDQGFEVIGVSLDQEREALVKFVGDHQLPWPQIFFDEPGARENNPLAREHGVVGIPATFLVDRAGRLVGQGLYGEDLIEEVGRRLEPNGDELDADGPPRVVAVPVRLYGAGGCGVLLGALIGALLQRRR